MGTNLFVEGAPSPVVIAVTLPREATTFKDVSDVSRALSVIDGVLRRNWHKAWSSFGSRRQREVYLLRFRVDSPPFFEILCDPAWLAVLLAVLTGYKSGKESVRELSDDTAYLVKQIKGLGERQLQLLDIAVRLTLDQWLEHGEAESLKMAQKFRGVRERLLGDSGQLPSIEVKDIDKWKRPW